MKKLILSFAAVVLAATGIQAGDTYSLDSETRGDLWAVDSEGNTLETATYTLDGTDVPAVSVASGVTATVGFEDIEYLSFTYSNTSSSEKTAVYRMASDRAICNNSGSTFTIKGLEANQYVVINLAGKGSTAPVFSISSGATEIVTPTYDGNKTAYDLVVKATDTSITIKETSGGFAMYSYTVLSYDDGYATYGDGTTSEEDDDDDDDDSTTSTVTGTTIYAVTTSSTENTSTELTLADDDENYSSSADGIEVSGGKVQLTLDSSSSQVVGSAGGFYGIKVGKSADEIVCTPTNGFSAGDVVVFTGFIKNGASKVATVKVTEGDSSSSSTVGTSFADITEGGDYYVDGNPNSQNYTVTADCSYITIARSGSTTMYIQSIEVIRPDNSDSSDDDSTSEGDSSDSTSDGDSSDSTDDSSSEGDSSDDSGNAISSVSVSATVLSTEYYTLSGAKVTEPVKGITIVKEQLSDGSVRTSKIVK